MRTLRAYAARASGRGGGSAGAALDALTAGTAAGRGDWTGAGVRVAAAGACRAAGRRHLNKEPRRRPRSRRPGAGRPSSGRRSGLRPARRRRHRRLLHPRANTCTTSIEVLRLSRPDRLAGAGRPSNSSSTGVRLARRQGRRRLFRTGANTRGSSIRAVLQRADEETVRTPQHSRSTWIVNCTTTSRNSPRRSNDQPRSCCDEHCADWSPTQ